jgi:hypothetical protein
MNTPRFHRVTQGHAGRWLVVHDSPMQTVVVDVDCLTRGAAERECDWLNLARDQEARLRDEERRLCGILRVAA